MAEATIRAYDPMRGDTSLSTKYPDRNINNPLGQLLQAWGKLSEGNPNIAQGSVDPRDLYLNLVKIMTTRPTPTIRGPDAYALEMLGRNQATPVLRWLSNELKDVGGLVPNMPHRIGAGTEMTAFKLDPSQHVLKLRPGGLTNQSQEILANRPGGVLPSYKWGNMEGRMGYVEQPFARPMLADRQNLRPNSQLDNQIVQAQEYLEKLAAQSGYRFADQKGQNIGMWQGKPYILDIGSLTPIR